MMGQKIWNLPLGSAFRRIVLISGCPGLQLLPGLNFQGFCSFVVSVDPVRSVPLARPLGAFRPYCVCSR
jgi:hypothetical protein